MVILDVACGVHSGLTSAEAASGVSGGELLLSEPGAKGRWLEERPTRISNKLFNQLLPVDFAR